MICTSFTDVDKEENVCDVFDLNVLSYADGAQ